MSKLHFVRKAAKTRRGTGIKKGEPYWWYNRPPVRNNGKYIRGARIYCKNKPRRSAYATQSEFIGEMMDLEDGLAGVCHAEDLKELIQETIDRLRELVGDCEEKKASMESVFPNGCPTIELLGIRAEACETIANELESAASEEDVIGAVGTISWDYE